MLNHYKMTYKLRTPPALLIIFLSVLIKKSAVIQAELLN